MNGKRLLGMLVLSTFCITTGICVGINLNHTTIASAAAPILDSTFINICVDNKSGAMRLPPNGRCVKGKETLTQFAAGPAGPAGATGTTGAAGVAGLAGVTGVTGPAGPQGLAGPAGPIGATGPSSIKTKWMQITYVTDPNQGCESTSIYYGSMGYTTNYGYRTGASVCRANFLAVVP